MNGKEKKEKKKTTVVSFIWHLCAISMKCVEELTWLQGNEVKELEFKRFRMHIKK